MGDLVDPLVVLDQAKAGQSIDRAVLDELARGVADPDDPRNKYTMIYALGRASLDARYADVIRPFLHSPQDPWLARMAVQMRSRSAAAVSFGPRSWRNSWSGSLRPGNQ